MVDEPAVCVGLPVDVVDRMKSALETLVDSDPVALGLARPVISHQSLVHLRLLVNIRELVFLQRLTPTLAFIFGTTHQGHSVSFLILSTDLVIASRMRNRLLPSPVYAFVRILLHTYRPLLTHLQ